LENEEGGNSMFFEEFFEGGDGDIEAIETIVFFGVV